MTCCTKRLAIAGGFCALAAGPLAQAASIGIQPLHAVTPPAGAGQPTRGVVPAIPNTAAPGTSPTDMNMPGLTQYLCPNPVQFNEKVATSPTAGGWTGDDRLESYYLDGSDHPFIKDGVMYCVYVPGWLPPSPIHPEWYLHQPVGKGTCFVRPDYKGFACRQ
jgi:hypothetical protein